MVGEIDTDVPSESTFRYAAALQATDGPYGERERRDFLVRHLLGVDPPNPNRP